MGRSEEGGGTERERGEAEKPKHSFLQIPLGRLGVGEGL